MKHFILIIVTLFSAIICSAQVPQAFSFQSLVIDENNAPVRDQMIGVQIQILDESASGTILYSESHRPTTNSNGLYTLEIGNGDRISGSFEDIDWLSGAKYVALSHDVSGGSDYRLVGSSQLLSVPYALASGTSFIEPKIYASRINLSPTTFDITEFDAKEIISYRYDWIQGDPEDVYIEYSNLPDNINIQQGSRSIGYQVITSNMDTIFDGFARPNSSFGIIDPNVPLVPGSYEVDITFRTETEILEEIKYALDIIDPGNQEIDCTEDYVGVKVLETVCDSINFLEGTSISVEKIDNKTLGITDFLDFPDGTTLSFRDAIECTLDAELNQMGMRIGDFEVLRIEVREGLNGELEFFLELVRIGGDDEFQCELIYR